MENIDPLILQNDQRHETLRNIEVTSEHQLLKQDEISEGIKDLNRTVVHLLEQGDKPEVQKVKLEGVSLLTIKGEKGDTGSEPADERLKDLIMPLIPAPIKGDRGDNLTFEMLSDTQKSEIKGEKGERGEKGEKGEKGDRGQTGPKGETGLPGIEGKEGKEGPRGPRGEKGQGVDIEKVKELESRVDFALNMASKTTSLSELDDVNLTGLTQSNGKYNLGSGGSGGSPALPVNSVQFNNAGAFGGSSAFTYAANVLNLNPAGTGTTLTNPLLQSTNSVDNFTQISVQNKSATVNSSADFIAYPDNNTNDTTGFVDIGITSSNFNQAAYAITTPNDSYLFGSAVSGAGKIGNLVIATDSTGSSNSIVFGVNGFTSLNKERARIDGATGAFSYGFAAIANGIQKFFNSTNSNTVTIQSGVTSSSYTVTLPTTQGAGALTNNGAGVLTWSATGGSGITRSINNVSVNTSAGSTASVDYVYNVSNQSVIRMPTAVGNTNRYTIKNVGYGIVNITFNGAETADNQSVQSLLPNISVDLMSNGSNWNIY